uniref:Uncharacterized protein n=1 Tax=Candidatus Kentrum sp. TC TaxID=2126339 RepID=A0A450Y8I4_9GAMM|nr:MAG: hypothetical protein BECKTC1821E_GA0114239_1001110 [Candidatus Kentron sp. TC]
MQGLDFELEEFHVPETRCHLPKSFHFVVGSFQWSGGKMVEIIVGKNA